MSNSRSATASRAWDVRHISSAPARGYRFYRLQVSPRKSGRFSGLSRLWYRAELLHHAEHVHLHPALHDLALQHPVYGMTYELDPLAGRAYSLELAQMRTQKHEPVGHLLPFGDLLHVGASVVREGSP